MMHSGRSMASLVLLRCAGCQRSLRLSRVQCYANKTGESLRAEPSSRYIRTLKWAPIPLGVGLAVVGYQQLKHIQNREEGRLKTAQNPEDILAKDWQVRLYTALPLRVMSRLWGRVNNIVLPEWMRSPLYKTYIWAFNCNMEEAAVSDLRHYKNLGEFFRRKLNPSCRPINQASHVTSPSDGKVLSFGVVEQGLVEQVKGVTYSLRRFLGAETDWERTSAGDEQGKAGGEDPSTSLKEYEESLKSNSENRLYHCVVYLAPGDYHGFHSPVPWTVKLRRHFSGELLSVSSVIASWIQGLFVINERAVYTGSWQHGFFSLTAVGATNVGSIRVYHDKALQTNCSSYRPEDKPSDWTFYDETREGIPMRKGESFGEFNLGSTIVLIFEAPASFEFQVEEGQKIKFGEPIGKCKS